MKNLFRFLLAAVILSSCGPDSEKTIQEIATPPAPEELAAKLDGYLQQFETPPQVFTISSTKASVVKGVKGSLWHVVPGNLETVSGAPVQGDITVELKELTNTKDFLRNNIQTVSDGRLLVSGGSYHIRMAAGGEELKLKSGKTLSAELPKFTEEHMSLFYGERDSMQTMNWKETGIDFETAYEEVKAEKQSKDTAWFTIDRRPKPAASWQAVDRERREEMTDEAIDSVISYVDGKPMSDERKDGSEVYQKAKRTSKNIYKAIQVENLGWINVDKFLPSQLQPVYVSSPLADTSATAYTKVFLVYKDMNSIMEAGFFSADYTFTQVPVNTAIRVIGYRFTKDKIYFDTKDIITGDSTTVTLAMREATDDDVNAFFD